MLDAYSEEKIRVLSIDISIIKLKEIPFQAKITVLPAHDGWFDD
ncbi:MAG: hypothetical protein ACU4EQ_07300 [Candidatus Nitrosoglobus sp.]|jgi:hypothetical protein